MHHGDGGRRTAVLATQPSLDTEITPGPMSAAAAGATAAPVPADGEVVAEEEAGAAAALVAADSEVGAAGSVLSFTDRSNTKFTAEE